MAAETAIYWVWFIWGASWVAAALWADQAAARPGFGAEALYRVVTFVGAYMLFAFASPYGRPHWRAWSVSTLGVFARPLWRTAPVAVWALLALTVAGFAFCWWARLHLGRLWSGNVTRKAAHRIVDSGPYALVRHPIYTGLLVAGVALALEKATPVAFAGLVVLWLGCDLKARLEERFLREGLGPDAYDAYRERTPMLIPFLARSRLLRAD